MAVCGQRSRCCRAQSAWRWQTASFALRAPLLNPAHTHPAHTPPQRLVYLLDEILEMARQSSEAAQAIADAIKKKLEHRSPVVKFKARVFAAFLRVQSSHTRTHRSLTLNHHPRRRCA